ncbi:MAG: PilZ domain-containing protein [Candidatus Omnitrophica bacterium]|nr:PilZ domain-containing protein [Candidatus Omnitrophota bacterium]MCM8802080.1 PilZ domain-containing protein [Candidatus Omnitrophota bacterium]
MVSIDTLKEIRKVSVFIDNEKINGEIIDIDKWGKMIISVPQIKKTIPVELGKRGEIFFEKDGVEYFISGKIFSQGTTRMIFLPETDILTEKRRKERFETPFIKSDLIKLSGRFHKEIITGNIINISLSGVKIETNIPLIENSIYELRTTFVIAHKSYFFRAKCKSIYSKKMRNVFLSGLEFIEIDYFSQENLNKYIKYLLNQLKKDALNF